MSDSFKITIGDSEFGSCDYGITINDKSWDIYASYLRKHPLYDHIHTAVNLFACLTDDSIRNKESKTWECCSVDEPGKIRLKFQIKNSTIKIDVHHFYGSLQSSKDENTLVAKDITVELMDYIEAVVFATAHTIKLQGMMGLTEGFGGPTSWGIDGHAETIPFHLFLYLATIVKYGEPNTSIGFTEEFNIINEMAVHYLADK